MKKILSLLTAIILTASGTSGVISCGSKVTSDNKKQENQKKADAIKAKMANTTFSIQGGSTNTDASQTIFNSIIDAALKTANPNKNLTDSDLNQVTYSGVLKPSQPATITATITVGTGTDKVITTKTLTITWNTTDQQHANIIKAKIQTTTFSIQGASIQADASASPTKTAIDAALKQANITQHLTDDDLTKILYSGTLIQGGQATITATITIGNTGATATKDLSITWNVTNQQKADAIKAKIQTTTFSIQGASINADASQDKSIIDTALKNANPSISTTDLATISYSGTLTQGTAAPITATITVGTGAQAATTTKDLSITWNRTNQQKADAIKAKIQTTTFSIQGASINADASQDKSIIDTALKNANPSLSTTDLATISYSGTLTQGTAAPITATITVGTGAQAATATKDLSITWNLTNQQKADAIKAKIQTTTFSIQGASINADASQDKSIIDTALKNANPSLSTTDLATISYSGTLTQGTAATITATITVGTGAQAATATKDLSITWNLTDQQKADAIKAKIQDTQINLNIDDIKQNVSDYKTYIKVELDKKLTNAEKNIYNFDFVNANTPLTASLQNIAIKIKVGASAEADANIKIQLNFTQDFTIDSSVINTIFNKTIQSINYRFIGTNQGLYITSDNGNSYIQPSNLQAKNITIIKEVNVGGVNKVYIGTANNGLYETTDGISFTEINNQTIKNKNITTISEISISGQNNVYIGTTSGLFRTNNGQVFLPIDGDLETKSINVVKKIDLKGTIVMVVGTTQGLYTSTDGTSFTEITNQTIKDKNITCINYKGISNQSVYIGTTQGLYTVANSNFSSFTPSITNVIVNAIINTSQYKSYIATNQGLYVLDNYEQKVTGDLANKNILTLLKTNNRIYVGTTQGLYTSTDLTSSIFSIENGDISSKNIKTLYQNANEIYVGTDGDGIYYNFVS